jgi:hypothetical protein
MSKRNLKTRLFALTFAVLTGALGVAATLGTATPAEALFCCSTCDPTLNNCLRSCGTNQTCISTCNHNYYNCTNHCSDGC